MKRLLTVLALLALAATTVQAADYTKGKKYSGSAGQVGGGYSYADSLYYPFQVNSSGYLSVVHATAYTASTTPIISDTCACGMADSSVVIDVSSYRTLALAIKGVAITDTSTGSANPLLTLAVQLRSHIGGLADSNSTFPWNPFADSTLYGARTALNGTYIPTSNVPSPSEFIVKLVNNGGGAKWGGTANNVFIPIASRGSGQYPFPRYMSVRVRNLDNCNVINNPTKGQASVKVYLIGSD